MTQAATQITLSLAGRVRDWSRLERDLAIALRGLHPASNPLPPPEAALPAHLAPFVHVSSPGVTNESVQWIGQPFEESPGRGIDWQPMATEPTDIVMVPPVGTYFPIPDVDLDAAPRVPSYEPRPFESALAPLQPAPTPPAGPFDDFIASVADSTPAPQPVAPLPPPSRFMVRVAPVGQPHRATKRNYDYFEELNARLAARAASRQPGE